MVEPGRPPAPCPTDSGWDYGPIDQPRLRERAHFYAMQARAAHDVIGDALVMSPAMPYTMHGVQLCQPHPSSFMCANSCRGHG